MLRPRRLSAAWAVLAIVGLAGLGFSQRPTLPDEADAYAPPKLCAECHSAIWDRYRLTGMGRSFSLVPPDGGRAGNFELDGVLEHAASDSRFTMLQRDGKYYQRREQTGFDGKPANIEEKTVDYVLGSGNHARTFLHRTSRNTLVELPLAWYAEDGGRWAMNPGFDQPDHWGFRREITYECMFCHNGYPRIPPGSDAAGAEPVFSASLPEGIDCQRCHGPGSRHAELARAAATAAEIRGAIVNPSRLAPERQMEVCLQCHLETTSAPLPNSIRRYERGPFSYVPGTPLGDFRLYFDHVSGSGRDDKFEIVSAAYRLRQSACFRESKGALLCTTCHDPHGETAPDPPAAACARCHESAITSLIASGEHPKSTACADCHMPKRRTDDVVHALMTDHRIQRFVPGQDLTRTKPEPRSAEAGDYQGAVVPYYPQPWPRTPVNELYLAVAQTRDGSNLTQGISQLETAITQQRPSQARFYVDLAEAFSANGDNDSALLYYREAVRRESSAANLRKLSSGLRRMGRNEEAATIVKRGLDATPSDYASWHELGLIRMAQDLDSEAISAFESAIALNPDLAETHNNLGALWMRRGDRPRAESAFRAAVRVDPSNAEAHGNLGNLLAVGGDFAQAERHFKIALRFRPDDNAARYNYAVALTRSGNLEQAKAQLLRTVASNPDRAEAQVLLGDLLRAEGQTETAMEHYRQALRSQPDQARAHLSLGVALVNTGHTGQGLAHLRTAANGADDAAREEAVDALRQLGLSR